MLKPQCEEVSFTELIQHPTRTTGRLNTTRALRLRRRDANDLLLMPLDRAEQESEVISLTARLLSGILTESNGQNLIQHALFLAVPWIRFLPDSAVHEFVTEFVATIDAASLIENMAPVAQLLAEWRHTADVYADPNLHSLLTEPHEGDFGPVPTPETLI